MKIVNLKYIFLFCFLGSMCSCKKERITKGHEEFVGFWKHYTDSEKFSAVEIESSGGGTIYDTYDDNPSDDAEAGNWFIKGDGLIFGHFYNTKIDFKIDIYPTEAESAFIIDYDTVSIGDRYMKLDGDIYISKY